MESRSTRGHGGGYLNQLQPPWLSSLGAGIAWPAAAQRWSSSTYTCGYCKREFRSAQALGGHMNVHRRERARLRHFSMINPNPSLARAPPLPNLNISPPHCPGDGGASAASTPAVYSFLATASAATTKALEVNLELGVGVGGGLEDGLDLELRLGCS